jgi:hypothetical protein
MIGNWGFVPEERKEKRNKYYRENRRWIDVFGATRRSRALPQVADANTPLSTDVAGKNIL